MFTSLLIGKLNEYWLMNDSVKPADFGIFCFWRHVMCFFCLYCFECCKILFCVYV
jgi:hypothetical protein